MKSFGYEYSKVVFLRLLFDDSDVAALTMSDPDIESHDLKSRA